MKDIGFRPQLSRLTVMARNKGSVHSIIGTFARIFAETALSILRLTSLGASFILTKYACRIGRNLRMAIDSFLIIVSHSKSAPNLLDLITWQGW